MIICMKIGGEHEFSFRNSARNCRKGAQGAGGLNEARRKKYELAKRVLAE